MHLPEVQILSAVSLLLFFHSPTHAHSGHAPSQGPQAGRTLIQPHSIQTLPPSFFPQHHSRRLKLTYGPYDVPSMHQDSGMISFGGLVAPPCTNCLITYMSASLSYPSSIPTEANASTGMWLHHTVWTNLARPASLPSSCPTPKHPIGDRFFASGNERTPIDLTANGTNKAGYPIYKGDVLGMGGELMNMRHEAQEVVVSVTFEFVPKIRRGWGLVSSLWLDVGGCRGSRVPAREGERWEVESLPVGVEEGGRVVFVAGHLHDGGVRAEVLRNEEVVCESLARYQKEDKGVEEHISRLSACVDVGETEDGDEWRVKSYYDTKLHAPMRNMDGSLEPVMGISLVYVAVGGRKSKHGEVKIFLGVGILVLSMVLAGVWAKMNGRNWAGRRKGVVRLEKEDGKMGGWMPVGRYRDEE